LAPSTATLSISCEGDPFFYESDGSPGRFPHRGKTIVDVIKLAADCGIEDATLQFYPPQPDRFPMLEEILDLTEARAGRGTRMLILPLISFHLFGASNGMALRQRAEKGKSRFELTAPGIPGRESEDWFAQAVSRVPASPEDVPRVPKMVAFLNGVYRTILAFAVRDIPVHFEIRGNSDPFTSVETANAVLDMILKKLDLDNPDLPFSRCQDCDNIEYSRKSGRILPLGRAADFFFDGKQLESRLYKDHIRTNTREPCCPNWTSWGEMMFDAKGFPQLCYSNIALTPEARTTEGPNLYKDGLGAVRDFYLRVWEDRRLYLARNRRRLESSRHDLYCPLPRFRSCLRSANLGSSGIDGRTAANVGRGEGPEN
jgi:hypothetical protein